MSWSIRESIVVGVVFGAVFIGAFAVTASPLVAVVSAATTTLLASIALARLRWFERRVDFAAAETQASIELAGILPLRAPLRPMTGWAITPELGAILVRTVLERRPKTIVELGSGVSSIVHGYSLELVGGGRVISLDHDAAYAEVTRREIALHALSDTVTVVDAPLVTQLVGGESFDWYSLANLPEDTRIDMLLVDGPPARTGRLARYPALPLLLSRLADGATLVLDDAARRSERAIVERWMRDHGARLEHVFHETRKGVSVFVVRKRDDVANSRNVA